MKSIEKIFLEQLQELKSQHAREVLVNPTEKTAFGFGQASGQYQGILLAEQLFSKVIGEADDE